MGKIVSEQSSLPVPKEAQVFHRPQSLNVSLGVSQPLEDAWQIPLEESEAVPQVATARQDRVRDSPEPISDFQDEGFRIIAMGPDVISRNVGQDSLIAIRFLLQDQTLLVSQPGCAVVPASQVEPELERHVETGLISWLQGFHPGDVVDAVAAGAHQVPKLFDPDPAGVDLVQSEARLKTALEDDEEKGVKERKVVTVEGAVDEETAFEDARLPR
ncbi:MAG TPA: hypothetical protein VLX28_00160 [Thermoanaerobaculia bacterium]|nr:hypothetical protein [Thermoanaerobaculia bacterium]